MSAKKTMRKSANTATPLDAGNNGNGNQPGYLGKLELLEKDHEVAIRVLNACQIRKKNADPATVAKYAEMLSETEPPSIIVILDKSGRYFIADGHNRTAAALEAGRSVVKANVYYGTSADAKLVGLEANQHGLPLSLAERKAALDDILDADGHDFTDSVLARMTGLDRHTVERRRRERQSGDFIAAAGKLRRVRTPEEMMTQAARTFAAEVEKHGVDIVLKALELLPSHLREDMAQRIVSGGRTQEEGYQHDNNCR